jgi:hypothetical protein
MSNPICLEKKTTLAGDVKTYRCERLSLTNRVGVLRYVIEQHYDVAGFRLSPGDETVAVYWEDRPYTLYLWRRKHQADRAWYFNIADSVSLSPDEFCWRDLAVDILIVPGDRPQVLDEQDIPVDIDPALKAYITSSTELVLTTYRDIQIEVETLIAHEGAL